jgi:hypothetical protein
LCFVSKQRWVNRDAQLKRVDECRVLPPILESLDSAHNPPTDAARMMDPGWKIVGFYGELVVVQATSGYLGRKSECETGAGKLQCGQ